MLHFAVGLFNVFLLLFSFSVSLFGYIYTVMWEKVHYMEILGFLKYLDK